MRKGKTVNKKVSKSEGYGTTELITTLVAGAVLYTLVIIFGPMILK